MSLSLSDLLLDIRTELRALNARFVPSAKPEPALLLAVLSYTGCSARFTAGELVEANDTLLREALAGMNAFTLGRQLSELEGQSALGRRLTKAGRGVDGNEWCFT